VISFFSTSIPKRTLAALLSIFILTYAGTAIVVYSGVRASTLETHAVALNQLAELKYQQIANEIDAFATDITAWSQLDVMNDLVSGDIDQRVAQTLHGLKQLYGLPGDIYAFGIDGNLISASSDAPLDRIASRIPKAWETAGNELRLITGQSDPFTRVAALVIEIPVFGSFDKTYRVGTLAMTYPWSAVGTQLSNGEAQMSLVETGNQRTVLAANANGAPVGRPFQVPASAVIGRSTVPGHGLVANWQVLAAQDASAATDPLRWIILELMFLGCLLGVPIVFFGRLLSGRLTAPIAALTRAVCEIADTDKLEARVPVTSRDELGSLARYFNVMTERLAKTTQEREQFVRDLAALNESLEARIAARTEELKNAVDAQKRLIGDISHEIKSPLARLSMALGLAHRKAGRDTARQFDRMEIEIANISALASELLTLARLDRAATPPDFAPVDLSKLVEKIVNDALFERPSRRSDLILRKPQFAVIVNGNADFLRRAIENVIRNALFYTAEKTAVEVTIQTLSDTVCVEVMDHGSGVPESALPHLFEPFYRVDAARTRETGGTGIGLSICERVLRLHGGTARARHRDPQGLVITMEIPLAGQDAESSRPANHRPRTNSLISP
jgi:signal transduction histidine kinase